MTISLTGRRGCVLPHRSPRMAGPDDWPAIAVACLLLASALSSSSAQGLSSKSSESLFALFPRRPESGISSIRARTMYGEPWRVGLSGARLGRPPGALPAGSRVCERSCSTRPGKRSYRFRFRWPVECNANEGGSGGGGFCGRQRPPAQLYA